MTSTRNVRRLLAGLIVVSGSLLWNLACGRLGYEELTPNAEILWVLPAPGTLPPGIQPVSLPASTLEHLPNPPMPEEPSPPSTGDNEPIGIGGEALILIDDDAAVPAPMAPEAGAPPSIVTNPKPAGDGGVPRTPPPTEPDPTSPEGIDPTPDAGETTPALPRTGPERDAGTVAPPVEAGPPSPELANHCPTLDGAWTLSAPEHLSQLSSPVYDAELSFSADGLNLYFVSPRDAGRNQLFLSDRADLEQPFSAPTVLPVQGHQSRFSVFLTNTRAIQSSRSDLYLRSRSTPADAWGDLVSLDELNSPADEWDPWVSQDGRRVYFASNANGALALYLAQRASVDTPFSAPTSLASVNTSDDETHPSLSSDETILIYTKTVGGLSDIWYATRDNNGTYTPVGPLPNVNSPENDGEATFGPDGCSIYFSSTRPGGLGSYDFYRSELLSL